MLTSRWRLRPSFIIVGAQRAGTTTLYRVLSEHPARGAADGRQGHRLLRPALRPRPALVRRAVPARPAGTSQARARRHHLREQRLLPVPPAGRRADRQGPARRARRGDGAGAGRARLLRAPPRAGPRLRDRGVRAGHRPRGASGWRARSRRSSPTRRTRASTTATTATSPAAATASRSTGSSTSSGRDRVYVVDADVFFADPAVEFERLRTWLGLPAWQPTKVEQWNARPRTPMSPELRERLDRYFEPYDARLAEQMGRAPSWRSSARQD